MNKRQWTVFGLALAVAAAVLAATGTVTYQSGRSNRGPGAGINTYAISWTSTAGGAAGDSFFVEGEIVRVVFVPGSGGTQPTDLYDVTILDDAGVDVLAGQGANLSNAAPSDVTPGVPLKDGTTTSVVPVAVRDTLTMSVTNAGNAKTGQIILYWK